MVFRNFFQRGVFPRQSEAAPPPPPQAAQKAAALQYATEATPPDVTEAPPDTTVATPTDVTEAPQSAPAKRPQGNAPARCRRFLWWLLCLPVAGALTLAAQHSTVFAEWYASRVYPLLAQPVNFLTGLLPFSAMELVCTTLLLAAPVGLILLIRRLLRLPQKKERLRLALRTLAKLVCAAAAALLVFVLLCGINYHRYTFAQHSGLPVQESTVSELKALCHELAGQANTLAAQVPRDESGVCDLLNEGFGPLADAADRAYAAAAAHWPILGGSYGSAKPMAGSFFMSRLQLTGIFFPFTVESNVNALSPSYNVPVTICHELAHLRGFMREDEANFIATLACAQSSDVRLQYSGVMLSLVYAGNALAKADPQAYAALRAGYDDAVQRDLAANNAYWDQFEDKPLSELGEKTNDAYLKANGQTDGTKSYGRMVDLLLAQRRAELAAEGTA